MYYHCDRNLTWKADLLHSSDEVKVMSKLTSMQSNQTALKKAIRDVGYIGKETYTNCAIIAATEQLIFRKQDDEEWSTCCLCYGHEEDRCLEADCDPNADLEWEEPKCPAPKRGKPSSPAPKRGEAECPDPKRGEAEPLAQLGKASQSPAIDYLLLPPPPPEDNLPCKTQPPLQMLLRGAGRKPVVRRPA
ncbi:UNVERIFIED_CONTAM: hypothetical protein FKN15_025163 [Acipenser sinensis]